MDISARDAQELYRLEEALWLTETRFSQEFMEKVLAPDFFEFGRSGRWYHREATLTVPAQNINAVFPLIDFKARLLEANVAQVTYISVVHYPSGTERAMRSSIWTRAGDRWRLRFHQGTAIPDELWDEALG